MAFTIKNLGTAKLGRIRVSLGGKHRKDFRLVGKPPRRTLKPGQSTRFRVVFAPKRKGVRRAELIIRSNDANENPFNVSLRGKGRVGRRSG